MKFRIRFEPIDVDDKVDFIDLYEKMRKIINNVYSDNHKEVLPSIGKIYPVEDSGFPIQT
jgi:hypothetical protein